jgi:hypothetical protein
MSIPLNARRRRRLPYFLFSNGGLMVDLRSSHAGTGRFLERRNAGSNNFD